jgi:hypothetical protein
MAETMADSETVTAHGGVRLAKDLFSGAMGGIAQVLLGQSLLHNDGNFTPRAWPGGVVEALT